jgi:hypothetical protein
MISYGSCAAAIPRDARHTPADHAPLTPGDDIVSRLERKHSRVSPIVLRNDNPRRLAGRVRVRRAPSTYPSRGRHDHSL